MHEKPGHAAFILCLQEGERDDISPQPTSLDFFGQNNHSGNQKKARSNHCVVLKIWCHILHPLQLISNPIANYNHNIPYVYIL